MEDGPRGSAGQSAVSRVITVPESVPGHVTILYRLTEEMIAVQTTLMLKIVPR